MGRPLPPPPEKERPASAKPRGSDDAERREHGITRILGRSASSDQGAVKLEPGKQVPGTPYRIVRWIGDGGMGIVYEAEHVSLERRVALKVLRPEASGHALTARLFREEARTVSKIGSAFIVEVFDLDELPDGRLWFAMELLRGRTLADELEATAIEPARAIAILRQVCKGLAAAHNAGVIHRDIKPGNIALSEKAGRADAVKLLDFGVSALASDVDAGVAVRAGTPYYMAPEVVTEMPYDARVDLYSLGCAAFEMLCQRPPFVADGLEELLVARLEKPPPSVSEHAKVRVPEGLAAVIAKCLARHADDRYENAEDVEAALCEAQIDAELRTAWDDLELPPVEGARRDRLLRRMPDPTRIEAGGRTKLWVGASALALALGAGAWWIAAEPAGAASEQAVEDLTHEAHAAAAKSYFVYPPGAAPQTPTAYTKVLELERLDGGGNDDAQTRADQLRIEFSETLVRLGDQYWEREGGRPFAIDYYAAALMFDGGLGRARERVTMTPGELTTLRQKAEDRDFTAAELEASDALIVLADPDPEERLRRLEALQADPKRSAMASARLSAFIDVESAHTVRRSKPSKREPVEPDEAPTATPPDLGTEAPVETPEPVGKANDREEAKALSEKGNAALRRGDVGRARKLFEMAISADPRFAAAHDGLGRAHFHRGAYAEAARVGAKAVRMAPRRAEYRVHLGDAYYKAFRYEDALEQYEHAGRLGHAAAGGRITKTKAKLGG